MSQPNLPGLEDDYDPRPYIASQRWVYAKTVPTHPHEYVVPEVTTDPAAHYDMVKWINRVGEPRMFAGKRYKYAEVDGYVYWIGPRTIINRRRVDVVQDTEHYPS